MIDGLLLIVAFLFVMIFFFVRLPYGGLLYFYEHMAKGRQTFLIHLTVIVMLCVAFFLLFFSALHWLTRHGKEMKVPNEVGKNVSVAVTELRGMHFDVWVDSAYEPGMQALVVLKQAPDTGAVVKEGRMVFLTVNMTYPKMIAMPNLVSLTYSSAVAILQNDKLIVGDTVYKPSISAGIVLEQRYKGKAINAGTQVAQGSKIDLVIGDGKGNQQHEMPTVTHMSVDEATTMLSQYNLQIVVRANGAKPIADTADADVVRQLPEGKQRISNGDTVVLYVE